MASELVLTMRLPDRSDIQSSSQLAMERAAIHAVSIIQRRTAKGQGVRGPFAPYSRAYAAKRAATGRNTSPVDLTLTGTMLRGLRVLRVEPTGRRAWIGWEGQHTTRNVIGLAPTSMGRILDVLNVGAGRDRVQTPLTGAQDRAIRRFQSADKSARRKRLRAKGREILSVPYALLIAGLERKRPFFDLTKAEADEVRQVFRRTIVDGLSRRITTRVPTRR